MVETGISYFSSRTLRYVQGDLEDMVAHHCTYVVHCLTETDLLFYRETMQEIVEATHEAGLDAWLDPWGVAGVFSGDQVAAWSYDATGSMSALRPARPDVVWRIIGETYAELRGVS